MIRLANIRERHLGYTVAPATAILAPTTTATLAPRWIAAVAGKVKALVLTQTTTPAAGNSTDLKDTVKLQKRGITGAVTAVVVTTEVPLVDINLTPDLLPPAGTEIVCAGLPGNHVVQGEVLEAVWTETGTVGTATRPQFSIIGVLFEADSHLDPTLQA